MRDSGTQSTTFKRAWLVGEVTVTSSVNRSSRRPNLAIIHATFYASFFTLHLSAYALLSRLSQVYYILVSISSDNLNCGCSRLWSKRTLSIHRISRGC